MQILQLLSALAAKLELPSLQLDMQQCCALRFMDGLHLDMHYAEQADTLCLAMDVGSCEGSQRQALVAHLLRANLDPRVLQGAHFAMKPHQAIVTLCRTLDLEDLDSDRLLAAVSQFAATCRHWRIQLGLAMHQAA